jgi:hypothetical protein
MAGALPERVELIMDGNRRWARQMGMADPSLGHKYGAEHAETVLTWCEAVVEVSGWINTTKQERADAEAQSRPAFPPAPISPQEINDAIEAVGGLVEVIINAESGDKADLYRELGLRLTYRSQKRLVEARVEPGLHMCKRFVSEGGLEPPCPVKGTSTSS